MKGRLTMAWRQIVCPKCKHHMSHQAKVKNVGRIGSVYKCPKCGTTFPVRKSVKGLA